MILTSYFEEEADTSTALPDHRWTLL